MFTTLISAAELHALCTSASPLLVLDCSFDLAQPDAGAAQYAQGHIPGAFYAHLDQHLSAAKDPATGQAAPGQACSGGRHPLPTREALAAWLGGLGLRPATQVVVYDRQGHSFAPRLWWLLQWLGHEKVAVLNGGWQAWLAAGGASSSDTPALPATHAPYPLGTPQVALRSAAEVLAALDSPQQTVVDARAAPRFRGEVEPLDPVAGHIPGALNRPFTENMGPDGCFKPAAQLRQEWLALLQDRAPASVVHQCGSGVTALPNLLAFTVAGLGPSTLFAGSWSEWCSDPTRPVAKG